MDWKSGNEDVPAAHHAKARKHGVMNRVSADVAAVSNELDLDDDKIMDVLQVIAEALLREGWVAVADQ